VLFLDVPTLGLDPLARSAVWEHVIQKVIARGNPLTYQVDALRMLMLQGGTTSYGLGLDAAVLVGATAALVVLAGRLYPRLAT
jgi:hypothetical protein